jgi:hypothetical protein
MIPRDLIRTSILVGRKCARPITGQAVRDHVVARILRAAPFGIEPDAGFEDRRILERFQLFRNFPTVRLNPAIAAAKRPIAAADERALFRLPFSATAFF